MLKKENKTTYERRNTADMKKKQSNESKTNTRSKRN